MCNPGNHCCLWLVTWLQLKKKKKKILWCERLKAECPLWIPEKTGTQATGNTWLRSVWKVNKKKGRNKGYQRKWPTGGEGKAGDEGEVEDHEKAKEHKPLWKELSQPSRGEVGVREEALAVTVCEKRKHYLWSSEANPKARLEIKGKQKGNTKRQWHPSERKISSEFTWEIR